MISKKYNIYHKFLRYCNKFCQNLKYCNTLQKIPKILSDLLQNIKCFCNKYCQHSSFAIFCKLLEPLVQSTKGIVILILQNIKGVCKTYYKFAKDCNKYCIIPSGSLKSCNTYRNIIKYCHTYCQSSKYCYTFQTISQRNTLQRIAISSA